MLARSSALAAVVALGLVAAPAAHAKECNVQRDAEDFGPSYITTLQVKGVSCAGGKKVVRAFHRCRKVRQSISRRCRSRVLGYSCKERGDKIPTMYTAKVTCTNDSRRVVHTFTQFT